MKRRGDKIVMITAYDAPAARLADEAGVELILVGDTAAMVMLGHSSTIPVTLDEMIFLTRAVTRAARRPLVVGDLPFGTYEVSDEQAVSSAIRMVKEGGADVVKLEGAGPHGLARARDRGVEHRGDGSRRTDASVGDEARRLQGAGQHRGRGEASLRRRTRSAGRGRVRGRARSGSRARGSARHRGARRTDDRHRGRCRHGRPGARVARHARHVRRPDAALRQALRRDRRRDRRRGRAVRGRRPQRGVPGGASTRTRISDEELAAFEAALRRS